MKTVALVNSTAGGVGPDGARRLRKALSGVGLDHAELVEFDRTRSEEQLRSIEEQAPDLVIAWGGDGTHRSVMDTLGRRSSQILLLPGGTMNILTKWLHAGHDWERVLWSVLASPRPRILPAGRVNNSHFFCAMLAGVPARLADAREDMRHGKLGRALQDAGAAMDSLRSIHLATSFGKDRLHADGHFPTGNVVGALVGPLAAGERMGVARLELTSAWSALEFAWTSFVSDWRNQPGVSMQEADMLMIENLDRAPIPAMIDGEKIDAADRLEITFVEEAATCLVAPPSA